MRVWVQGKSQTILIIVWLFSIFRRIHQKHPIFILSLFATLGMPKSQPKRLLTESSQSGNGQDRNAWLHKYSLQTAYMRKNIAYMPFFLMRIKNHSAERKKSFSADWKNEMTKNGKKPLPIQCCPKRFSIKTKKRK